MVTNNEIISNNLKNLRQAIRCPLKLLAWFYDVTPYFIKKWESGKGEIPEKILRGFAQQAQCTYEDFCKRTYTATEIAEAKAERDIRATMFLYQHT
jgi:hypothetical protein